MRRPGIRSRVSGAVPWMFAAAILVGMGRLGWGEISAPPRGADGCFLSSAIAHRIVLLDASDPLHPTVQHQVGRLLVETATKGGPGDRFSLYTIGDGKEPDLLQVFSGCNVGRGALAGQEFQARAAARFLEAPGQFLAGLTTSTRTTSPLFESLDSLLHRRDVFESERVELIVVSDFLQHTAVASHYRSQRCEAPAFLEGMKPDLIDLARLIYVQRPRLRHLQTQRHQVCWLDLVAMFTSEPPVLEKF